MSISKSFGALAALAAAALAFPLASGSATAAPLAAAKSAVSDQAPGNVQDVRHRGWRGGGFAFYGPGIYIGPRYGGYYNGYYGGYGYSGYRDYGSYDDGYYPRYRYSRDRYYDRPHRKYSRRWTKDRFEHPLGRR